MLVGRRSEVGRIDLLMADARAGKSAVLVVRGEAGIGKSELLQHALDHADGMATLYCVGMEAEAVLAYAALHQLFRPAFDQIDKLPKPQADALRSAFALSDEGVDDRFRIAAGVLGMLSEIADEQPLLCIVDDAHWLDHASREALLFAARRLHSEPIALLFAARDDVTGRFRSPGLAELRLRGLNDSDARRLAATRVSGTQGGATVDWLVANAEGNPLALMELAESGGSPGMVPTTTSVEEAYLNRVRALPAETQDVLLIAATDETGDRDVISRAADAAGFDPNRLAEAEAAGLVDVGPALIRFRHPLVRSAAYRSAGFADREQAHRVLAEVLTGPGDADRRAWHRAAATVGADEEVASELEATAGRAQQRAGYGAAADALVRAADLSEKPAEEARRLLLAATSAQLAGQHEYTVALADRATRLTQDPLVLADLAGVRGAAEVWHGRPADSSDRLATAAEAIAPIDTARALRLAGAAAEAGALAGDTERIGRASRVSDRVVSDEDDRESLLTLVPRVGSLLFNDDVAGSAALYRQALSLSAQTAAPRDVVWGAIAAVLAGEYDQANALYRTAASRAREQGALGMLWYVLTGHALCNVYFSYVSEAAELANEALTLASDLGTEENSVHVVSVLGWVAAIQGDEAEMERLAQMIMLEAPRGIALPPAAAAWGRAELALAQGRWDDALVDLTSLSTFRPGFGHPMLATATAASLVEASVRSGNRDLVAGAIDRLRSWVDHTNPQHRQPLLDRALALVAETPDEAAQHYEASLRPHPNGGSAFIRARTELLFGEHLRRDRKRNESRIHLRAALQGFGQLGATPWVERAANELRAAGEAAGSKDPSAISQLTPQELQIARLVTGGGSNKEIAGQLFLSHRTVEYHISKIFTKLGISSRAELIRQGVDPPLAVSS